jgi:hypothetical protein
MEKYLSMLSGMSYGFYVYMFDKLDGSQVRAEWKRDKGFWKYGSRNRLMDENSDPILGHSIELMDEFEDELTEIFEDQHYQKVTCFFEFWGPNSFAGVHDEEDEGDFEVALFDVWPEDQGVTEPRLFWKRYGHLKTPELLYKGKASNEVYNEVIDGTLEGMTREGVVCKGSNQGEKHPTMFKIKSEEWLDDVKEFADQEGMNYSRLI